MSSSKAKTKAKKPANPPAEKKATKPKPAPAVGPTIVGIDPAKLRLDGGTQPRESINLELMEDYAEAMKAGVKFPPVVAFRDHDDEFWLADGFHRTMGAIKADLAMTIIVEVHEGSRRDAVLYSLGANASHGLRRSNADKRRAVMTMLDDPEWGQWTASRIATACGVDEKTVAKYRPDSQSGNSGVTVRKTVNKHGQEATIETAQIGKHRPSDPADSPASEASSATPKDAPTVEDEGTPGAVAGGDQAGQPDPIPTTPARPEFVGDEPEPVAIPDERAWLDALPCRDKLTDWSRPIFTADALDWKWAHESPAFAELRKGIRAREKARPEGVPKGEFLYRLGVLLDAPHPKGWLMCSNCMGKGCDSCRRRGYVMHKN